MVGPSVVMRSIAMHFCTLFSFTLCLMSCFYCYRDPIVCFYTYILVNCVWKYFNFLIIISTLAACDDQVRVEAPVKVPNSVQLDDLRAMLRLRGCVTSRGLCYRLS